MKGGRIERRNGKMRLRNTISSVIGGKQVYVSTDAGE